HDRPRCLRCGAHTYAFGRWIFVGPAGLTPAPIVVLTALQPITAAQYPVLLHISADCAQAAQHLPGTVNVVSAPAAIPRAILILSVDQIFNGISHAPGAAIKPNVTKQLKRARSQIAAGWIENRVVIRKRHVFQPRR